MSEDEQRRILRLLAIEKEQRRSHESLKKWATENFAILGHWKRAAEIKERAAENFSVLKSAPAKACSKKCTAGSNVGWVFRCLSPCQQWHNTQDNGCWVPPSDHNQSETLFQTRQDQEKGWNGPASHLHSWRWVFLWDTHIRWSGRWCDLTSPHMNALVRCCRSYMWKWRKSLWNHITSEFRKAPSNNTNKTLVNRDSLQ